MHAYLFLTWPSASLKYYKDILKGILCNSRISMSQTWIIKLRSWRSDSPEGPLGRKVFTHHTGNNRIRNTELIHPFGRFSFPLSNPWTALCTNLQLGWTEALRDLLKVTLHVLWFQVLNSRSIRHDIYLPLCRLETIFFFCASERRYPLGYAIHVLCNWDFIVLMINP